MSIKITTWNVNGLRSIIRQGFHEAIQQIKPDILCLQEIKAHPEQIDPDAVKALEYPFVFWNPAQRKGYSGTLVLSRIAPQTAWLGLSPRKTDEEGRVITLEFPDFFIITVYTPNVKRDLSRLDYRYHEWDPQFRRYVKKLNKQKPVIFCGDLNVAHKEIDLANPKSNYGNAGFTDEEREGFQKLIDDGFIDCFRHLDPRPHQYTWWSYRTHARKRNVGWRIDYVMASAHINSKLKSVNIHTDIWGSDHCPVSAEFHL